MISLLLDMLVIVKLQKFINNLYKSTTYYVNKFMKGGPGGLCPPGFGLSFLLVHPLLRRVAGAPACIFIKLVIDGTANFSDLIIVSPSEVRIVNLLLKISRSTLRLTHLRNFAHLYKRYLSISLTIISTRWTGHGCLL